MAFENLQPLFGAENRAGKSDSRPLVIAGPCSAESAAQVMTVAKSLAADGIRYFRAGVWKPRTRPGSFEGIGAASLRWLADVRKQTGMIPLTEVATASHLRAALRAGIDAFWIGARTTANPFAVQDIADELASLPEEMKRKITLLVKNPVNPDIELWIGSLQRLYDAGIRRLSAVHRGFSAYGQHIYRNIPEWRIPIELKRRIPNLPLICDPSHIGGDRELVLPISQQALDMNFDGLMIEAHCDPDAALSDASQQVTPVKLREILGALRINAGVGADAGLKVYRDEIDRIDDQLVSLLAERFAVAREIGEFKRRENLSVVQPDRYNSLIEKRVEEGMQLGMSEDFMRDLLSAIHQESVRQQLDLPENK